MLQKVALLFQMVQLRLLLLVHEWEWELHAELLLTTLFCAKEMSLSSSLFFFSVHLLLLLLGCGRDWLHVIQFLKFNNTPPERDWTGPQCLMFSWVIGCHFIQRLLNLKLNVRKFSLHLHHTVWFQQQPSLKYYLCWSCIEGDLTIISLFLISILVETKHQFHQPLSHRS